MPQGQLPGTIQNDILKEFMVRNTYIYPPAAEHADHRRHLRLHQPAHAEIQQHQHQRLPHAGGRRHGRSRTRLHAGRRAGIPADRRRRPGMTSTTSPRDCRSSGRSARTSSWKSPSCAARHAVGEDRQARSIRKNPKSLSLRTHSQTSGWSLTAQDVYNNVIRTCVEAMAADPGPYAEPAHQCA